MVVSSAGLGPESDCSGEAQTKLYKYYRPMLSSERVPHIKIPAIFSQKTKIWSWTSDGSPTPRQTGRLTVGCKLTSTSKAVELLDRASVEKLDYWAGVAVEFSESQELLWQRLEDSACSSELDCVCELAIAPRRIVIKSWKCPVSQVSSLVKFLFQHQTQYWAYSKVPFVIVFNCPSYTSLCKQVRLILLVKMVSLFTFNLSVQRTSMD
jgi:hypothetical protein